MISIVFNNYLCTIIERNNFLLNHLDLIRQIWKLRRKQFNVKSMSVVWGVCSAMGVCIPKESIEIGKAEKCNCECSTRSVRTWLQTSIDTCVHISCVTVCSRCPHSRARRPRWLWRPPSRSFMNSSFPLDTSHFSMQTIRFFFHFFRKIHLNLPAPTPLPSNCFLFD